MFNSFSIVRKMKIPRLVEDVINVLFPAECHLCGCHLSPHERFLCTPCIETLPRTGYHRNLRNPMEQRFAGQFRFEGATGHFFYSRDSQLSKLIQDMKYRNFPAIGDMMGKIAGQELYISGFLSDIEIIVPLPMHFFKKARRGYNQVDNIARGISEATGLKYLDALKMTRGRKTQTSLSGAERITNAESLFQVRKDVDLNKKGVLLVDDICTTGATLGSAAKTLAETFPEIRLYLFALAVTF